MRVFHNLNVDFLGKRKFFYMFSLALFLIGLLNVVFRGLSFGIDFKGGSEIVLQFEKQIDITQVRGNIENIGLGNVEVRTFRRNRCSYRTELQELPKDVYPRVVKMWRMKLKAIPNVAFNVVSFNLNNLFFPNPDTTNLVSKDF
jgi:preprotein translocase subunit SecF